LKTRGTAVVIRDGKVLLVRDKGHKSFSLPGGGVKKNEPSLAAAVRELYEELQMSARKAERLFKCDFKGLVSNHKVSIVETDENPEIGDKELAEFTWWDRQKPLPKYSHVDQILKRLD
jgi:ADP-ribose pyrophosphatase YjhB (NUDIX family)